MPSPTLPTLDCSPVTELFGLLSNGPSFPHIQGSMCEIITALHWILSRKIVFFLAHLSCRYPPLSIVRRASVNFFLKLLLKNHLANFSQIWLEVSIGEDNSDLWKRGLAHIVAQLGAKKGKIWWIFKDLHPMNWQSKHWYLTYSILGTWFVKFAHKNKILPKMAPLGGASFYIGL